MAATSPSEARIKAALRAFKAAFPETPAQVVIDKNGNLRITPADGDHDAQEAQGWGSDVAA